MAKVGVGDEVDGVWDWGWRSRRGMRLDSLEPYLKAPPWM